MNINFCLIFSDDHCLNFSDAEYARSLEKEEEEAAKGVNEPEVPNLKEIMDMEMALATCRNDFVSY